MSFVDELRGTQDTIVADNKDEESKRFDWSINQGAFYNAYSQALQDAGKKPVSYNDFTKKLHDFVGAMGVEDGKWTKEDFDAKNYNQKDYYAYANDVIPTLFGGIDPAQLGNEDITATFRLGASDKLTGEAKDAYKRIKDRYDLLNVDERTAQRWSDDNNIGDVLANIWNGAWDRIGTGIGAVWGSPYQMNGQMDRDITTLRNYAKQQIVNSADMLDNYESYIEKYRNQKAEAEKASKTESSNATSASANTNTNTNTNASSSDDGTTGEEVTFTLTRGNDPNYRGFGQKIVDLGLATNKGLWGKDGDVEFYNKQLHDQGIYGNLPIGVPIKLKKRKV